MGNGVKGNGYLYNDDLAPVSRKNRTWSTFNFAALWVGMVIQVTSYTVAGSLVANGMNWWQALLAIFVGHAIMLIPLTLNAWAGTAYGIPFPVLLRAPFGVYGANIPALLRGLVACGWFGILTWIGGSAVYALAAHLLGFDPAERILLPILGISSGELFCFLLFWLLNMVIILNGIDCVKWLETLSAPFLIVVLIGLFIWGYRSAGGLGPMLWEQASFRETKPLSETFWPGVTAMAGFWGTLCLNIADFSRYARTQRCQIVGQIAGLPASMLGVSFIGVSVTGATLLVFGEAIWDPVQLLSRFQNPVVVILGLIALILATLSTNIAANIVCPANDFSNLAPRWISFKRGGLIAGLLGILIFPWKIYQDPQNFFFLWLIGYGALLGPIVGIMIADFYFVRRRKLDLPALYANRGAYYYTGGFNIYALLAAFIGVVPSVPGFLILLKVLNPDAVPSLFQTIYHYSWFLGCFISFLAYLSMSRLFAPSSLAMGFSPDLSHPS